MFPTLWICLDLSCTAPLLFKVSVCVDLHSLHSCLSLSLLPPIFPISLRCWEQQEFFRHELLLTTWALLYKLAGAPLPQGSSKGLDLLAEVHSERGVRPFNVIPGPLPVMATPNTGLCSFLHRAQGPCVCVLHTPCMENICVCVEARFLPGGGRELVIKFFSHSTEAGLFLSFLSSYSLKQ